APMDNVMRLAQLAAEAGMDGVVCSPREIEELRHQLSEPFRLVTPGIRPAGTQIGDQRRVMTPAEALGLGANYLVIGRPVTAAKDPMAALAAIEEEIS
ncbi:MAG: orotidine-5'-phosphate decarboxylase, partial [Gammaproteobacteria bacterium]|nr:orotidine-5'-phosphate decarboxylase [Gammaproteobacteria bacterium]